MVKFIKTSSRRISFVNLLLMSISMLFLFSCNNDEAIKKVVEQSMDLQVENEKNIIENEYLSIVDNCDAFSIGALIDKGAAAHFSIEINISKKGVLRKVSYLNYNDNKNGNYFENPDFNPLGLIKVKNFKYDETKKQLYFEIIGEIIEVESNFPSLDIPQKRRKIDAVISISKLDSKTCESSNSNLSFETEAFKFNTFRSIGYYTPSLAANPYQFIFNSENGYRLYIKSNENLWDLAKGTYAFDQNAIENRIDIERYIGIFRASQILYVRSQDWKKYETSGSYTIIEHTMINGVKVTRGEMNLQVYDNGILLHSITDGKFEVTGF